MMKGIAILGATGGLGEAIATRLAKRVPISIGYARNRDKAAGLAAAIEKAGGAARIAAVDLRDAGSVAAFIDGAALAWGGLDAVVSATGPAIPLKPLSEVSEDDFHRIYGTDVFGSFNVLRHGAAALKKTGGGSIVLLLTTAVLRTLENDGMSGGPKTAVAALMKQVAREMGPDNIRCNGIAPGVIDAGIVHSSFEVDHVAKAVITDCLNKTPLGRMGQPEDIAAAVDFLTSADATYISGQVLAVDGGYSA
jgi:NAD(P)-dependent dehydrogenase (short-subunit alcohol dehydrogenase family)